MICRGAGLVGRTGIVDNVEIGKLYYLCNLLYKDAYKYLKPKDYDLSLL